MRVKRGRFETPPHSLPPVSQNVANTQGKSAQKCAEAPGVTRLHWLPLNRFPDAMRQAATRFDGGGSIVGHGGTRQSPKLPQFLMGWTRFEARRQRGLAALPLRLASEKGNPASERGHASRTRKAQPAKTAPNGQLIFCTLLTSLRHMGYHRIMGHRNRRRCFLVLLSAAILVVLIVLRSWLFCGTSVAPPVPESSAPVSDDQEPIRFK